MFVMNPWWFIRRLTWRSEGALTCSGIGGELCGFESVCGRRRECPPRFEEGRPRFVDLALIVDCSPRVPERGERGDRSDPICEGWRVYGVFRKRGALYGRDRSGPDDRSREYRGGRAWPCEEVGEGGGVCGRAGRLG
jgi:hypothetical protein